MRADRMIHGSDIRIMANLPNRKTHRWAGYDYANVGAYYLTICTQDRLHLFGKIMDGAIHRSPMGEWAQRCWDAIPEHMPHVDVGDFVVMPNHVHGIVVIRERLVDMRGDAGGVGARHDAPGIGAVDAPRNTNALIAPGIGAGGAQANTDDTSHATPDDPGTEMPSGDPDMADAHGPHTRARNDTVNAPPHDPRARHDDHGADAHDPPTRARHDAPLRDPRKPPGIPRGALGQVVASYKSAVTRMAYRDGLLPHGTPVWQRNYWDRVIRDDGEHGRIAKYIRDNPMKWEGDRFNR